MIVYPKTAWRNAKKPLSLVSHPSHPQSVFPLAAGLTPHHNQVQLPVLFLLIVMLIHPPQEIMVRDHPNDAGSTIIIAWKPSSDNDRVERYVIFRKSLQDSVFTDIGFVRNTMFTFIDDQVTDTLTYVYRIGALSNEEFSYSELSDEIRSFPQVFHTGRVNVLVGIFVFAVLLIIFVFRARLGKKLFIRKIPGLEAVEEAVGRATEMGKPILYVPGLGDIDYTSTIASMNILGEVAKMIAVYDTPLVVCNRWSVTYTVAKEVVRESFATEGRPDRYKEDYVRYLTEAQFGFAAAVNGIMVREKPATNFFIGSFWAESLIMAETGAQIGAIQIAGTDQVLQLPFFVAACDYTLIGEELYAASAYLSRQPLLLGSLKAQDYGKLLVLILIFTLTILSFLKIDILSILTIQ
jgi:hypothetical protein